MSKIETAKKALKAAVVASLPQPVKPQDDARHLRLLLYGVAGAGKTTLAGSAAAVLGKTAVIQADPQGSAVLQQWSDNIDVFRITNLNEVEAVGDEIWKLRHGKPSAFDPYSLLVVDSYSTLAEMMLDDSLADPTVSGRRRLAGVSLPALQDYQVRAFVPNRLMRLLFQVPGKHVIGIFHAGVIQDQDTGKSEWGPLVHGTADKHIMAAWAREMWYAFRGAVQWNGKIQEGYWVATQPYRGWPAKTSFRNRKDPSKAALPQFLPNNMEVIVQVLEEAGVEVERG